MRAPLLAMMFTLALASATDAAEICMVPSAANNRNITVACGGTGHPNGQIGYRTDGVPSCSDLLCCEFTPCSPFGWTISSSATDPFANSGALAPQASLYLWLVCEKYGQGMAAAECDLVGNGLTVIDFVAMNGFLSAGSGQHVLIAVGGCPSGPVVAGRIDVEITVGVTPFTWGRVKSDYR